MNTTKNLLKTNPRCAKLSHDGGFMNMTNFGFNDKLWVRVGTVCTNAF